jgi:uncharacterized coiled-coil protein SlyX
MALAQASAQATAPILARVQAQSAAQAATATIAQAAAQATAPTLASDSGVAQGATPIYRQTRQGSPPVKQAEGKGNLREVESEIRYLHTKEISRETEISAQKQTIKELSEKLEGQEKILRQMSAKPVNIGKPEMKMITEEIMARLDRELHMERQRRGLF